MDRRWILRFGPALAAVSALGAIAGGSLGVTDQAWTAPPCPGGLEGVAAAVGTGAPATPRDLAGGSWFTLDARVDDEGELAAQRLRIGLGAARARFVELPPESSASGPFGSVVLVVSDDGLRSTIRAVDGAVGCAWTLGAASDVVRRATLDPGGRAVYEFRVRRVDRADLGVWRRPLDGSAAERVVDPIAFDDEVGATFITTLHWTAEGDRLVVQSCGALRCRLRLLDTASGDVTVVTRADGGHGGELIGVAGDRVYRYAPCRGLPCAVESTDLASGRSTVLAADAGLGRLVLGATGPLIAVETGALGGSITAFRPDGSVEGVVDPDDPTLRLMPGPDRAAAGVVAPPGWVVLAPDGRSPDRAVLIRLADSHIVPLAEVTP